MLNLMKLVFYLLLYVHGVGCFWWLTVSMGYPEMYYIDLKNNLYVHSDINVGLYYQRASCQTSSIANEE